MLIFFYATWEAARKKRPAGDNPWGVGATTLEWTLSSPPPFHQFTTLPQDRLDQRTLRPDGRVRAARTPPTKARPLALIDDSRNLPAWPRGARGGFTSRC